MIAPGATLGVLGGGQLGLYFAFSARRQGFRVWVWDPDPDCPAAGVADRHFASPWDAAETLETFCAGTAAITVEREHLPLSLLAACAARGRLAPGVKALTVAQDRRQEKIFLQHLGLATAPFAILDSPEDLAKAIDLPYPAILKTAQEGYDGKGQVKVARYAELATAWASLGQRPAVLEAQLDLQQELSVVLVRGDDGMSAFFPVVENQHRQGILDLSIVPARCSESLAAAAMRAAMTIADALDYVGVLAVEFFVDQAGHLLVNELAPRPHNSGHYTLDACVHSQFDQQVRALCLWPLADTRLLSSVVMMNLLGDLWIPEGPDWSAALCHPQVKPWLYGKAEARAGRKMGHLNVLASSTTGALAVINDIRSAWGLNPA